MLLSDVSGMFTAVEFEAFVALNIKKSNAPSPLVVPLVILIVGGHNSTCWVFVIVPVITPPHSLFIGPELKMPLPPVFDIVMVPELLMVPKLLWMPLPPDVDGAGVVVEDAIGVIVGI